MGSGGGRLGNQLHALGAALIFAKYTGAQRLRIPPDGDARHKTRELFQLPEEIWLGGGGDTSLQKSCEIVPAGNSNWWRSHCKPVPARVFHDALVKYIRPYINANLSACVKAPATKHEKGQLTVHLRGEDYWPAPDNHKANYSKARARPDTPCSLFDKIFSEGKFKHLLIVTSPDRRHPCARMFQERVERGEGHIKVQSDSIVDDACALLRAPHLALSYSTLAEGIALLSDRAQHLYHSGGFEPEHDPGVDWCTDGTGDLWPGAKLLQYSMAGQSDKSTLGKRQRWILDFPMGNITSVSNKVCS